MNRGNWKKIPINRYNRDPQVRHKKYRKKPQENEIYTELDEEIRRLLLSIGKEDLDLIHTQISICYKIRNNSTYKKILLEGKLYNGCYCGYGGNKLMATYFVFDLNNNLIKERIYKIDLDGHTSDVEYTGQVNVTQLVEGQFVKIEELILKHDLIALSPSNIQ